MRIETTQIFPKAAPYKLYTGDTAQTPQTHNSTTSVCHITQTPQASQLGYGAQTPLLLHTGPSTNLHHANPSLWLRRTNTPIAPHKQTNCAAQTHLLRHTNTSFAPHKHTNCATQTNQLRRTNTPIAPHKHINCATQTHQLRHTNTSVRLRH